MEPLTANESVVVTGAGVVSAIGSSMEEFQSALYSGGSGVGPSELFGADVVTAEVRNFAPQKWLGNKGIRILDRSTRLLCVAAQMALSSAGLFLEEGSEDGLEVGLVCGTMFGGLHSIASFDWSGVVDGPNYVSPMEFPNTVINSPAGQAAIRYKLRGGNTTICAGPAAGLYAMHYAAESLRWGRAQVLLAGGVEELCEESLLGFQKTGAISPSGCLRPFAKEGCGTILGEGSALLVLESETAAQARGAKPWLTISGFGCAHDAHCINQYHARAEGATWAIEQALESAAIPASQISCIIAGANGNLAGDAMEARALRNVFGTRLGGIPVCAPKASFGEALGASGALLTLVSGLALQRQMVPPTANYARAESDPLRLSAVPQLFSGEYALINTFSCDGNNASLIVRREGVAPS